MSKITFVLLVVAMVAIVAARPRIDVSGAGASDGSEVNVVDEGQQVNVVDGDEQVNIVDDNGPQMRNK